MTTIERTAGFELSGWPRAAVIIARAAGGLMRHGLLHPFRPAVIVRATGRVVAR
ncbi:MAG: hypothetical protein LC118_01395 [Dehalococcoidia bacterium]|nr:hypothetical protein [Dehalococcoidia bacterium]